MSDDLPVATPLASVAMTQQPTSLNRHALFAVCYLGFCFFVLFAGVATFRSLVPSLKPSSGAWLIAVNFVAYGLGSLLHPRVLFNQRRICLVVAALAHSQWIALLQLPTGEGNGLYDAIGGISSIVNGGGAGLLWATQGGWLGEVCRLDTERKNAPRYSAVFLAFYGVSGLVGNIVAALTFHFGVDVHSIVWYLFGVSLAGALLLAVTPRRFLYVERFDDTLSFHTNGERDDDDDMQSALSEEFDEFSVEETLQSDFVDGKNQAPAFVAFGASRRFVIGNDRSDGRDLKRRFGRLRTIRALFCGTVFTRALPVIGTLSSVSAFLWVAMAKVLAKEVVPIVFAIYAVANACGPPLGAFVDRRLGTKPALLAITVTVSLPACIYFVALHPYVVPPAHSDYAIGFLAVCFGVVIGAYNNAIYALFATEIDPRVAEAQISLTAAEQRHLPGEAFCMHGFFYCIFYAAFSFLAGIVDLQGMAALATSVVVVAIVALILWIWHENKKN
jgi:hypothetical protein